MALEAVVSQQEPCSYGFINSNTFAFEDGIPANYETLVQNGGGFGFNNLNSSYSSVMQQTCDGGFFTGDFPPVEVQAPAESSSGRRKRRRVNRSHKNKEELENQRMTHITVERNRRKQMNDYLNALRSLMPPSYVHRVNIKHLPIWTQRHLFFHASHWLRQCFCVGRPSVNCWGGD